MNRCLKQTTFCRIIRETGEVYEATNLCDVDGLTVCPRVTAGCKTGEGYELCGSTHAEANAAKLAAETKDVPGIAFLFGHTWMCKDCQDALRAVNVNEFHICETLPKELK
jgi:deoxycytidylate deaminase